MLNDCGHAASSRVDAASVTVGRWDVVIGVGHGVLSVVVFT
jgi:hypothetical protein